MGLPLSWAYQGSGFPPCGIRSSQGRGRGVQSSGGRTADWYLALGIYRLKPNLGLLGATISYSTTYSLAHQGPSKRLARVKVLVTVVKISSVLVLCNNVSHVIYCRIIIK